MPSPQVAAAILESAQTTPRVQQKEPQRRPKTAAPPVASEKSPARVKVQEPLSGLTTARTVLQPPRVAASALSIVPRAAAAAGAAAGAARAAAPGAVASAARSPAAIAMAGSAAGAAAATTTAGPQALAAAPAAAGSAAAASARAASAAPASAAVALAAGGVSAGATAAAGTALAPVPAGPEAAAPETAAPSSAPPAEAAPESKTEAPAPGEAKKESKEGKEGKEEKEKKEGKGKEAKGGKDGKAATGEAPAVEGGGGGGPATLELKMPEPPTEPSKATKRRIAGVQRRAGGTAAAKAELPEGDKQVGDARDSVDQPDAEALAKAKEALIVELGGQVAPSPEIVKLCERIREVIRKKRPPDEDALMEAEPEGEALDAGNQLNSTIQDETKKVEGTYGPIDQAPTSADGVPGGQLPDQPDAAKTPGLNAATAVPDPVPDASVSLDADAAASKQKMTDAGMDKPTAQLVQSGPIAEARGAQGELEQTAKEDPAKVLASQKDALAKAETDMAALQAEALAALTSSRAATVKKTAGAQKGMVESEAQTRARVSGEAQTIFDDAQRAVNALLKPLVSNAMNEWETAKTVLVTQFKNDLAPVQREIDERHSGVGGFFVGLWDAVTGLPDWAEKAYSTAEYNFSEGVIEKIKKISADVNTVIATCELLIKTARDRIAQLFEDNKKALGEWADTEKGKFDNQLDALQKQALSTRDNFNKDLMNRSAGAVDEVRVEIAELRKKAAGLLGRIADAINRFIDDPIKFIIDGLLDLLGIPPAAFWAVVAKIKKVIGEIADDPLGFASNLLSGLAQGFSLFFENLGTHIFKGFIDWLTGGLAQAGVQLPKDLSLKSIVTFLLQLMGITWPRIRKVLAKHVGEKNIALLEKVYSMVSFLIEKGPEGIFEMIQEKLNPQSIVDQVVQLAVDYMVSAIVKVATARIIALFNPVGAILQALEAIYRVLKWVFQNAAKIFTLIETVVNGIADILKGNIGGFAKAVEKGLAMLIAPVISFIADYCALGDLPQMIAEKIKSFQEWIMGLIDQAIGFLVEKGKALLAAVGIGKKDKKKEDQGDVEIGKRVEWNAEGEPHELWITVKGSEATVMMASNGGGPVAKQLDEFEKMAKKLKSKADKERRESALYHIGQARAILAPADQAADDAAALAKKEDQEEEEVTAKDQEVESAEDKLWPHLQAIQIALRLIKLPETTVSPTSGSKGGPVLAEPLSKIPGNTTGSPPSEDPPGWDHVTKVDRELLNPKTDQYGPRFWRRMHLLSEGLHGPGEAWNLVPAVEKHNSAMKLGPERDAKSRIADDEVLYYSVDVDFHSGSIVENFPSRVDVDYGSMRHVEGKWERADKIGGLSLSPDKPPLKSTSKISINTLGRDALISLGLRYGLAESIAAESPYDDQSDLRSKMKARYAALDRPVDFNTTYWPEVRAFIADNDLTFG